MQSERYSIKRKNSYDNLKRNYDKYNIVYLHTPIGWGRMLLVEDLIENEAIKPVLRMAWNKDFLLTDMVSEIKISHPQCVVIDEFEKAMGHGELEDFVEYLKNDIGTCKFVIGSSMDIPKEMRILSAKNNFSIMRIDDVRPTKEEVKIFLKEEGILVNDYELECIKRDFYNMPLCITLLVSRLHEMKGRYSKYVSAKCKEDLFLYLESVIFRGLPVNYQNHLLKLSNFEDINVELVENILHITKEESEQFLLEIHRYGDIFNLKNYNGLYGFNPLMGHFLRERIVQYISYEERSSLYGKALLYYSKRKEYEKALVYAGMIEDGEQIARLLCLLISQKGNDIDYFLMEQYINQLPLDTISARPKLLLAKAMICAMIGEKKEADYWYRKLEKMVEDSVGMDDYEEVLQCMNALYVVMPGQNTRKRLEKLIFLKDRISYTKNGSEHYIPVTFTSNLPSVLHGTKDFCKYAPKYQEILTSLHEAFARIFGKKGTILLLIAAGEVLYEQNQITKSFLQIEKAIRETKLEKDASLHFTAIVTLCKVLLAEGEGAKIHKIIGEIENTVNMYESISLYENMQAFIVEVDLIQGNYDKVFYWLKEIAPKDDDRFCVFLHYQYIVKIKILILQKKYNNAHSMIDQVLDFVKEYDLLYLKIQLYILQAITYFKEEDKEYIVSIKKAMDLGRMIGFIRVFADEGVAIYPLLVEYGKGLAHKDEYYEQLLKASMEYKTKYPNYLKLEEENELLTSTEYEVLRFLAKGIKNSEIAKEMFVSENTVKYHLKNIYTKLEVTSRSQAIKEAMDKKML
ncbi:MAG: LuxR C-terminal-related transcriptional regulator [Eubacteriales bacterium]